MKDYNIITSEHLDKLMDYINIHLSHGYLLLGGVSQNINGIYMQVIYKPL